MRYNCKPLWTIVGLFLLLIVYCEYLVYYFVLWQCHWPELASDHDHEAVLKAFFIGKTQSDQRGSYTKLHPPELKISPIMYLVIHNSVVLSKILVIVVPF